MKPGVAPLRSSVVLAAFWLGSAVGAGAQTTVDAGEVSGYPGWTVDLPVSLANNGVQPSSVGCVLFFSDPRNVSVAARADGKPDCRPSASVATPGQFVFWPVGCRYEDDECDSVRALFVDLSGTAPNLPAGELFKCTVRIAGNAPVGTYPVRVVEPDAQARGGVDVVAQPNDGAVHVLAPPGGGGCAIARAPGQETLWWLLFGLAGMAWWKWNAGCQGRRQNAGRLLGRAARSVAVSATLLLAASGAQAQAAEFAADGTWSQGAQEGTWHAVLGIDSNGGISGRIEFHGLAAFPRGNVLATSAGGRIQQGSLFHPGTIARAGRLRGLIGASGVVGEVTLPDGTIASWKLSSIRATREKIAPEVASRLLSRRQPAEVFVSIDDYPAVRAARAQVRDLARYEWDSEAAEAAYAEVVARLQDAVLQKLAASGAVLLQRPHGLPALGLYLRDQASLSRLLSLPEVTAVHDPQIRRPLLFQSLH